MKALNGSIKKTFTILEHFTPQKSEWGVTELAKVLGANKSTVYRFLSDMQQLGILRQDPASEKYSLGLKLFELGNRVHIQSAFVEKTHPELAKVALEITETVHLAILKSNQVFYVDKVESPQGLKMSNHIGTYGPAHATSLGKVLLAFTLPEHDDFRRNNMLADTTLQAYTEHTITDTESLLRELAEVRSQGYAIDREEFEIGLICVAVPIFNRQNEIVASLSASGPANRFKEEEVENYVAILRSGATAIQQNIGFFKL
ncbi:IclR family transcriptional regulator [Fulvivirgaceae bacterium BMA12]|uniref:IclR family transcriptional regulator n=1 Tax=Agaribacillus aureus TaxID=3051825 RepID=A0ABT8L4V0_9BACT|nr:IclR family transcriptional regulator [Fulvivirgaceae bacterium BMA12]